MSLPVVQVEEDIEELRTSLIEEDEGGSTPQTEEKLHHRWEDTRQTCLTAQELGNSFVGTAAMVMTVPAGTRLSRWHGGETHETVLIRPSRSR